MSVSDKPSTNADLPDWPLGVCVFCGSSSGDSPLFSKSAEAVGKALASKNLPLVYGGGSIGLMGKVAASTLNNGGRVCGIMPKAMLAKERPQDPSSDRENDLLYNPVSHQQATDTDRHLLIPVDTMHTRKMSMAKQSAAFIGLPGGFGTFEEVFEMTTWNQLSVISKPVILLNVNDFYTPLQQFIKNAVTSGFISQANEGFLKFVSKPADTSEADWNWGEQALLAIDEWHAEKSSRRAYDFEWV